MEAFEKGLIQFVEIITTHKNVDFDALASIIAGTILHPDSIPILPKSLNPNVKAFLSFHKDLFVFNDLKKNDLNKVERLIVVDTNSWNRLEKLEKLRKKDNLEILLYDHHRSGSIHPTWKCQDEIGANITLMSRYLKQRNKSLSPIQSTLFLAGLYEDTGGLTFPSTKAEDAYTAAYLLEQKADLKIISSFLRPVYGEKQKDILFRMLQSTEIKKIKGYKVSINIINIRGHVGNLSVVVHMYREIVNVDVAFGIFVDKRRNKSMVIGRSSTDSINVGSIMKDMGGGGHTAAASVMIRSSDFESIRENILSLIKGKRLSSVRIGDLMSFPVFTVSSDTMMENVAELLREKGCTGVPIVDNEQIVGIISRRDFKKINKDSQMKAPVKAFMRRDVITIDPGKSPHEATRIMVKHDIGRLPVVEKNKLIGIVTRSDSMLFFYDLLPD